MDVLQNRSNKIKYVAINNSLHFFFHCDSALFGPWPPLSQDSETTEFLRGEAVGPMNEHRPGEPGYFSLSGTSR
jgi:hypothetical protein